LSNLPVDRDYFSALGRLAVRYPTTFHVNQSRAQLLARYATSKIFVHGTGFGESEARPELAEHFGIATVEAMAAGSVPVVINRGAQPEIVSHGENGLVWNTLDELKAYLSDLMHDGDLLNRLSTAARERASVFSTRRFMQEVSKLIGQESTPIEPARSTTRGGAAHAVRNTP
jgi:glycosyltransferase involved in cell wall biosynthesis